MILFSLGAELGLEEAEEGGHAAELVKATVHQVVRVNEAWRKQAGGLQGLQHCWDPTGWRPLKRESMKFLDRKEK